MDINLPINMYDPTRDYILNKNEFNRSIRKVLNEGTFINGPEITQLENKLANYIGTKHCIGVACGTDALKISLLSLNIKPGDEVITVSLSFISTVEVIVGIGAIPVFVDVSDDFCIDPNLIKKKITNKTKCILFVSLYGQTPDVDKINDIANKYNLHVIEDGAQSFGSEYKGKKSCSLTTIGITSFFPTKPFGCYGDGGACFTNDDLLAKKIRMLKNHGTENKVDFMLVGFNSRLDTLQAVILLVKFKYLDHVLKKRNDIAQKYLDKLRDLEDKKLIKLPKINNFTTKHVWAQFSVLILTKDRNTIYDELRKNKINVAIFYRKPIHKQQCYNNLYFNENLPKTQDICNKIINLPCYGELLDEEVNYICQEFKKCF